MRNGFKGIYTLILYNLGGWQASGDTSAVSLILRYPTKASKIVLIG